jgi:hypothetical protein
MALNSKLLVVILSSLFSLETSWAWISGGNGARHTWMVGSVLGAGGNNQKPPIPDFEASVAAMMSGARGTRVWRGMGLAWAAVASCSHSLRTDLTNHVRVRRVPVALARACCRIENRWPLCDYSWSLGSDPI